MDDSDIYSKLLNAAFRFLSFRPRSAKEVKEFLQKKTKTESVVDRVMDRLIELGYIDDAKFAAWWIQSRQITKPKGMRLIKQELKQKGIVTSEIPVIPEDEIASRAIQKKREIWKKLSKLEQKKKLYDFLGRRGFSYNTIARVIDDVLGKGYNTDEA